MALLDLSFAADFTARTIQNGFPSPYFNLLWVYTSKGTKFCPTRNFKVDSGKSMNTHANIFIFNKFCKAVELLEDICPNKFLQESVDHASNIQRHQQLDRFEGKMYVFPPIIFTEVNCVPSKLNYFVYEEQSTISSYHFNRYLEVLKEGCGVLKTVESSVFAREPFKPM